MSDLKGYLLGELDPAARGEVEAGLASDSGAREELSRLEQTRAFLLSVPDEEIPRRIAFVSDAIFEPPRRPAWFSWFAHPAFASSLVLAAAIGAHGWMARPLPAAPVAAAAAPVDVEAIVSQALAKQAAAQERRTVQLVNAALAEAEKRYEYQRTSDLARMEENLTEIRKYAARDYSAANFRSER